MNALQTKSLKFLATLFVFAMSISLFSCSLEDLKNLLEEDDEEEINNPEDVKYVTGLWEGELTNNYFFHFKDYMIVSVYTDSEGENWAMGFPHDYRWEIENDRIRLFETGDNNLSMSGTLKRDENIIEINWGPGIITLHKTNN